MQDTGSAGTATAYIRYATGYQTWWANAVIQGCGDGLPLARQHTSRIHLKSYEAGVKARTSDGTFEIDVAGYHIDWNNIQVLAVRNGLSVVANAGGAKDRLAVN